MHIYFDERADITVVATVTAIAIAIETGAVAGIERTSNNTMERKWHGNKSVNIKENESKVETEWTELWVGGLEMQMEKTLDKNVPAKKERKKKR